MTPKNIQKEVKDTFLWKKVLSNFGNFF